MTEEAKQVSLHELLAKIPADARLVIEDADGMGASIIPVGRHCQEAAAELRRLHALCEEMLSELYVYRASEYLKDVTAAIKARNKNTGEQA